VIPLGLSAAQMRAFAADLADHHQIRVRAQVQTLAGAYSADLTDRLLDGQVNVDLQAPITRSLTMTLLDEDRALPFDADSPSDSALFVDRMIRVWYGVYGPALAAIGSGWVDVPVFTGPISKPDRSGDTVTVEAQGKESLAMGACWQPMTLLKGTPKTSAIHSLMVARAGETRFSLPPPGTRLPATISLGREDIVWTAATSISRSQNAQLFYDGPGTCRLRTWPAVSIYSFTGPLVLSPLKITYGTPSCNIVWVKGGVPKGARMPISYVAVAPANHPLSPQRLGRAGVPRYLLQTIKDDSIRSVAEAKPRGDQALAVGLAQSVDATFDAMPVPHLDPGDRVYAATDEGAVTFTLSKFSLPLTAGQPMSVGYNRKVSPKPRTR
jgi:hypothetical protein